MAVLLALLSALSYGLSDFIGGTVSRRTSAWAVAVLGQTSSTVCTAALACFVPGSPRLQDFGWALLAGVGSGLGTGFLYRGFAAGRMSVVAPVSAVGAAVVPVVVGVAAGERPAPLVWLGILAALPGIWLVSSTPTPPMTSPSGPRTASPTTDTAAHRTRIPAGLTDALLAGLGFGALFAALGQIPSGAGLWPLALTQLLSVPVVIALALALHAQWRPRGRRVRLALLAGPLGAGATYTFLLATQHGYLTVSAVLASLYPASTVLLAAVVLREQIHRVQAAGLALCAVAIALVAGG